MPDWPAYVHTHLTSLQLPSSDIEQLIRELAAHLQEHYETLLAMGLPEREAFSRTCAQAGNWDDLCRGVLLARQEGTMSDRVKQIWVPTLVTLVLAGLVLAILTMEHAQPVICNLGQMRGVELSVQWLLFLPVVGAIGAYLSRRAQGRGWRVVVSGLSPALAWGVVFLLVAPFAFFVNPAVAPGFKFISIFAMVVSWVILPAMALGFGVVLQGMWNSRTQS